MIKRWVHRANGIKALVLGTLVILITGCSSNAVVSDIGLNDAPDWVNQGTALLKDHGQRVFRGVAYAPPMGDSGLQLATADNRARTALAGILTKYMQALSANYLASSGSGATAVNEQHVSRQVNMVTKINLMGARVADRWRNKQTDVIYSLVELDMKYVKDVVSKVDQMNEGLRNYLLGNVENIFDREMK